MSRTLIIVEDDDAFAQALARSFHKRNYEVQVCSGIAELKSSLALQVPGFAVVDLKVLGGSGLECVELIHDANSDARIIVLTGYASIATAVEAVKLGACHYLAKPANADEIEAAFFREEGDASVPVASRSTSIKNLEWERIHQTLADTGFNISEAARRLGMHRRTLARKLEKRRLS